VAYWDSEERRIVYYSPESSVLWPKWERIDCGCCNGIEWGCAEPRECNRCEGTGVIFRHIKSGVLALYPGGPFRGR